MNISKISNYCNKRKHSLLQNQLFIAAKAGDISKLRELISVGGDPFDVDETGKTIISYAMEADDIKSWELVLDLLKIGCIKLPCISETPNFSGKYEN